MDPVIVFWYTPQLIRFFGFKAFYPSPSGKVNHVHKLFLNQNRSRQLLAYHTLLASGGLPIRIPVGLKPSCDKLKAQ